MSLDLASTIAASVSALSSVVQVWKAAKDMNRSFSRSKAINAASQASSTPKLVKSIMVIDTGILKKLRDIINRAKKRLMDAIEDPTNTDQDIDAEMEKANRVICKTLERIKSLNRGKLPDTETKRLWVSHGCA